MEIEKLMACYCKSRETQTFYTNCLDDKKFSTKERDLIMDLIKNESLNSKLIRDYCSFKTKSNLNYS